MWIDSTSAWLILNEQIEVEMVHGEEKTTVTVEEITRIIEPRVAELLMMVQKEIDQLSFRASDASRYRAYGWWMPCLWA